MVPCSFKPGLTGFDGARWFWWNERTNGVAVAGESSTRLASAFNTGLIVQCIRVSNNPQTHHQALLLLSLAAQLFPSHVLHNIMAIFTFMGTSVLRQDDAYSFQVRPVESFLVRFLSSFRPSSSSALSSCSS